MNSKNSSLELALEDFGYFGLVYTVEKEDVLYCNSYLELDPVTIGKTILFASSKISAYWDE